MTKLSNFFNSVSNSNRIFTAEDIGRMTQDEFSRNEKAIDYQMSSLGIPTNRDLDGNSDVVYVRAYTRSDGTEVRAHYRSKGVYGNSFAANRNIGGLNFNTTDGMMNSNQSGFNLIDFIHQYASRPTGYAAAAESGVSPSVISETLEKGAPMSTGQARENVNPTGDKSNCQTCVVTYEARLRGYNVEALPNEQTNLMVSALERNQNMAWIDPKTGQIPLPTLKYGLKDEQDCYDWLNNTIQNNERYTLTWRWKNGYVGHVVNVDKDNNGKIRIYDPQSNNEISDQYDVLDYMKNFAYESPLKILRVDNLELFMPIVHKVIKPSRR